MVKRVYNLYELVYSFENLVRAEANAARGKRGRTDVAAFEYRLEDHLLRIQADLREKTYQPGPYQRFKVQEPTERIIAAAPYRDRVVHHALCRVIEPYFERRFNKESYASRLGKGTHRALDRCTQFAHRYPYVLRCDIVQFFPSIDPQVLREQLARVIGDPDVLWLCDRIISSGAHDLLDHHSNQDAPAACPDDDARPKGLPIGNQTSQFWGSVYLNALDQFIKRRLGCAGYVRYVDDFLLFAEDKSTLHRWKTAVIAFLATLRLTLHEAESTVFPVKSGIPFLGFRVYPDHRLLRRRNGIAFSRRYRGLVAAYAAGDLTVEQLSASVQGWVAHVAHGDTYGLRSSLLSVSVNAPSLIIDRTSQIVSE